MPAPEPNWVLPALIRVLNTCGRPNILGNPQLMQQVQREITKKARNRDPKPAKHLNQVDSFEKGHLLATLHRIKSPATRTPREDGIRETNATRERGIFQKNIAILAKYD